MIKLTIDHILVEATEGATVLEAAATVGISIPSLCFKPGHANHPSCMVCLVEEVGRDHLVPACAMPVSEGMTISTRSAQVVESRRQALELLLSDHVGDCEAPCRLSCPASMDIPLMNRLIAEGNFSGALEVVRREIALPLILGYICPAPCEKACKRKSVDQPVAICMLKRSTAQQAKEYSGFFQERPESTGKRVAIIGAGPAGLSAAFYLQKMGIDCILFDKNREPGGALRTAIPDEALPSAALDGDIENIRRLGATFCNDVFVNEEYFKKEILPRFDAVLVATGNIRENSPTTLGIPPFDSGLIVNPADFTTTIPGVFGCGNIIREQKMAVHSAAQGKLAALRISNYLFHNQETNNIHPYPKSVSAVGQLLKPELEEYLKESIPDHRISPQKGYLAGFTMEEAIGEAQRCMHCDCRKPESCKLRREAIACGVGRKHVRAGSRNPVTKAIQHDLVVYETEKCIRCGLCVEITRQNGEAIGLTYVGRGFDVRIAVPFHLSTREALTSTATACAEACPTGALSLKTKEERFYE